MRGIGSTKVRCFKFYLEKVRNFNFFFWLNFDSNIVHLTSI